MMDPSGGNKQVNSPSSQKKTKPKTRNCEQLCIFLDQNKISASGALNFPTSLSAEITSEGN